MFIQKSEHNDNSLTVEFSDQSTATFSVFWLRDHSSEATSLNPSTLQRDYPTFASDAVPGIKHQQTINDGTQLQVHWLADDVISEYDADFLYRLAIKPASEPVYTLWGSELTDNTPNFDFDTIVQSDESFLPVLEGIEEYGIATFSNMPTDMKSTQALLERVGYVRNTVFGDVWDFSNNEKHADSAYTSIGIGLHTDGTYAIDPPGLQLLHCLAFDGEGGFNIFVDGFKIAQTIKDKDPAAFEILGRVKVPAHYMEPGIQLRAEHEVVTVNSQGHFDQICFNNFDRSPMLLNASEQESFYHAYGMFQRMANDPAFQIKVQLRPGQAVWFDNWRTLHARSAFSGFRHMAGGYSNKEDFRSKLLTLRGQSPWKT